MREFRNRALHTRLWCLGPSGFAVLPAAQTLVSAPTRQAAEPSPGWPNDRPIRGAITLRSQTSRVARNTLRRRARRRCTLSGDVGVLFPQDESGKRGSLETNRAIWADSVRGVDPDLAARIDASPAWRKDYAQFVHEITTLCSTSRENAIEIAEAGLASARSRIGFERDGEVTDLDSLSTVQPAFEFTTETIVGAGEAATELEITHDGKTLSGDALRRKLGDWVHRGIIEPSAASALNTVIDNPDWLRLEGRRVVVLGAGAQTSPLPTLCSWGAEVVAVDLPRKELWERVITTANDGASKVHIPLQPGAKGSVAARAGANVIQDVPELLRWLDGFADTPLILGVYIYADGALHVQATLAADALGTSLTAGGADVTMAYAGTPSDCFLVAPDVVNDSNARRRSRSWRSIELPLRTLSFGKLYAPAYREMLTSSDGEEMGIVDAIVQQQGPNYSLAKRLQRWRTEASWSHGQAASFNVAPPTWTTSVTKNKVLAAGYYGARSAGLEVFSPETMSVLMTALLVHDLNVAAPDEHPELGLTRAGIHGGYWRVPHDIRTTLLYTGIVGIPQAYAPDIRFR